MDAEHLREIEKQLRVRVKTGCKTCRKRRIKCDERKPKCFRCLKSSRKCEGYEDTVADGKSPAARAALHRNPAFLVIPQAIPRGKTPVLASKPRNEPLSAIKILRNPNLTVFSDPEEARAFEFFRDRTSCAPSELFDSEFWGRRVLQLAYLEPAIKHGLLALSSLHESCEKLATFRGALWSEFALSQYSKAIHHSNVLMNTDGHDRDQIERILVSCILFTHYENLVGNYRLASMHLQNGMAILSQSEFWKEVRNIESPISTSQADDAAHLVAIFALLDLQASAFADCSAPYELSATQPAVAIVPPSFNSVAAARNCLLEIVRQLVQCLILFEGSPPGGEEFGERDSILFSARHALLLSALDEWPSAVDGLEEMYAARSSIKPCVAPAITLLRVYHRSTVIYTECAFSEDELSWDRHVDTFREMVDTIAAVSGYSCSDYPSSVESFKDPRHPPRYTPTTKTVHTMTLWTVATRCRDPFIRRQAIALMLVERRREGVWDSIGAARVAAEIVKVEEGLTGDLQLKKVESGIRHAGQVYLENRVRAVLSEVDMPRGGMRVRLWMTGQERAFRGPVWVSLEEA